MTAEEILQTLDAEFEVVHHDPPHLYQLAGYFYPADTRMTVFRSAEHWAIFFEIVGYEAACQSVQVDVRRYGDCFQTQSARCEARPLLLLDAQTARPLDGNGTLDPQRFSILWNGQMYHFTPSDTDYAEAGIVFDATRTDPEAHTIAQIVRYLCERLSHAFFLPEYEQRALMAQDWATDGMPQAEAMTLFLQTREWHHPDLSAAELPSQVSSFRLLAQALANGDTSEWNRQDQASFNTDWRVYDWEEKTEEARRVERETRQEQEWEAMPGEIRTQLVGKTGSEMPEFVILPGEPEFPSPDRT